MIIRILTLRVFLAISVMIGPVAAAAQDAWRGDGSWWLAQSKEERVSYLVGAMDGMALQERLVLRSHIDREDNPDAIRQRQAESMAATKRLLRGLNSNQIRDGLDVFYGDYRNRQIAVSSAMQIVIYRINSESTTLIESLLESMRRVRE